MPDIILELAAVIRAGLVQPPPSEGIKPLLERLFGERYHSKHRHKSDDSMFRDAYGLAKDSDGVPYAGLISPDNPPSGAYGGASIAWFPSRESRASLFTFVVGTRGLAPDEGLLTRHGHRRRIAALRRHLARHGIEVWSKPDPAAITTEIPEAARQRFPEFEPALNRYGKEIYCAALVPDEARGDRVVRSFIDLYAYERGWRPLRAAEAMFDEFIEGIRDDLFVKVSPEQLNQLLQQRRFVILEGPPGTGKTRMADRIRKDFFAKHGMTVQFHPAITYEDFVAGLSPDPTNEGLRFKPKAGWLVEAAREARDDKFLLVIDEVNRADLGKVLGEAIYLFEPREVAGPDARSVRLPHPIDGEHELRVPDGLYVLATMNTADRSVANIDLAVRRRFAFVTLMPDRSVVAAQNLESATVFFDRLSRVFEEHGPDEALDLLPGHSYFLAKDESELKQRFQYELLPLLREYLRQGFLSQATTELHAVVDSLEDYART